MITHRFSRDDRAVPPVIGVVVLVAIVIVLAAVVGAAMLGFTDRLDAEPSAAVDFEEDRSDPPVEITVQVIGADRADAIRVNTTAPHGAECDRDGDAEFTIEASTGTTATFDCAPGINTTITAIASYDGSEAVVGTHEYVGDEE